MTGESTALVRVRRSAEEWRVLVEEYEDFAGSQAEFCRRRGLNSGSLAYWRRKLGGAAFVEISAAAAVRDWDVELDLGDGMVLRVRRPGC